MKNFKELETIKSKLEYLITHNKNYTKKQYYLLDEIKEDFTKIFENATNTNDYIKYKLKEYISQDCDFLDCFKYYNKNIKDFEKITNYILHLMFLEIDLIKDKIYLDKIYLDINYLIINDKIINLDFIYSYFKDFLTQEQEEKKKQDQEAKPIIKLSGKLKEINL